ncbi:MAG: protein kinase [bacterium]|nr:protein kinase [bacterium]
MLGRQLGQFRILESLGAGGMGEVYRAEDRRLKRHVALKILPPDLASSEERLTRFQREAEALAAIDHPNIVHIYSVEAEEGIHFLTMQLVRGERLSKQIPEGGMSLDGLLDLAIPMCDALRAAHERGIVHRDLKPDNVMVDEEGRVKILDFGLAKLRLPEVDWEDSTQPVETVTEAGAVLGTVPYMSPEQLQGRPVDHRSDLFSFGIVLYEMATGVRPFCGDDSASIISSIMRDDPAPLEQVRPNLSSKLGEMLHRCLEKQPERRFSSASDLLRELERLRGEFESGRTVTTGSKRAPVRQGRVPRIIGAVALIALLTSLGIFAWNHLKDPRTTPAASAGATIDSLAVLPMANLLGDREQDYFSDGMTEALITDLSKIGALRVIARSSAMRYKGSEKSLEEIASELGVDALVEGTVQREGERVRISVQLIEAATQRNLWADRYERQLTSVLALQSEVAQAIAREIRIQVTPSERDLLAEAPEVDPEAYEAYLQGRSHVYRLTPADLEKALQYFQLALERDPGYAPAQAGIALVWLARGQFRIALPAVTQPKAIAAAARAVEMDERLGEAQFVLASVRTWVEWDWEGAEVAFRRAIELQPGFPEVRGYYAHYLMIMGRPQEAFAQMERTMALDPLNPLMKALNGMMLEAAHRFDEAEEQYREILRTQPRHPVALGGFYAIHALRGDSRAAYEFGRQKLLVMNGPEAAQAWERGYSERGLPGAHDRLAEWKRPRLTTLDYCPVGMALNLFGAGRIDEALDCFELAHRGRDQNMPYIGIWPGLDPLHNEPRFQEIMRQMRLPLVEGPISQN